MQLSKVTINREVTTSSKLIRDTMWWVVHRTLLSPYTFPRRNKVERDWDEKMDIQVVLLWRWSELK